jgi:DNA repair exonuclease SbcCD nuclease subunit
MTKRIVIHTADWHLGKNRKYVDYLEQQRLMLEGILAVVNSVILENINADGFLENEVWLVMAGDIFDRNEDTDREEFILPIISMIYPLMELKKKHPNFSPFFIDGNHDRQPHDPTDPHALVSVASPLLKMMESYIAVDKPKWVEEKSLLLVPFGQYTIDQILDLLKVYPAQFLVMHECCAGITTDVGWKPPRDQDHYLDAGALIEGAPQLVAVFLGDIHRSQKLDPTGICWYSGSPITLDHGHKMPKGVLIHQFSKEAGGWQRDSNPELRSLLKYVPDLKYHNQLGILDDPEAIPFDLLSKYQNQYLQVTVSADVYALIARQLPLLFESPNVAWEYKNEEVAALKTTIEKTEEQSYLDYYKPLIEQWINENGKELTRSERDACISRILKDFESRT